MNKVLKILVAVATVVTSGLFCEAKCCKRVVPAQKCTPKGCTPIKGCGRIIKIGKCKKYSWVSEMPSWKMLPEDIYLLPKEEQERFEAAIDLIPKKIRKQAEKTFKQRDQYLKRPNAVRDRNTFVAKLAKRSKARRSKLPDEFVLTMYDEMLLYGRSLITGNMEFELEWLADRHGFKNVMKFIRKVNSTSRKKGRTWIYPVNDPEFEVFAKFAETVANDKWCDFKNILGS